MANTPTKHPAARNAYVSLISDLSALLHGASSSANVLMEIGAWSEVEPTVDANDGTFRVRISNLDCVPVFLPATGAGYQIISHGSGWITAKNTPMQVAGVIRAPPKIDGTLVVSYRFSLLRWIWAWIFWVIVGIARMAIVAILLAIVAVAAYYMPWRAGLGALSAVASTGVTLAMDAMKSRASDAKSMPMPMPTPTPVPDATAFVRGVRVGGGRP